MTTGRPRKYRDPVDFTLRLERADFEHLKDKARRENITLTELLQDLLKGDRAWNS